MTAQSPNPSTDLFGDRRTVEQVEEGNELAPKFDAQGLIPCVTTDFTSGEVLMMGMMNREALARTIDWHRAWQGGADMAAVSLAQIEAFETAAAAARREAA